MVYLGYGEIGLNPLECKVEVSISCWPWGAYLGDEGLSTLCVSADICENQICVDENDLQYWNGTNIYTQGYYYPVLPKVTRYRTFDKYQMQGNHNYFYGTKMRWNANDKIAPITPEIIKTSIVSLTASFLVGQVTFLSSSHIIENDFKGDVLLELGDILSSAAITNFPYAELFFYI